MKLALLGIDRQSLALAEAAQQRPDVELTAIYQADPGQVPDSLAALCSQDGDWQELLADGTAVIVATGGEPDSRDEQLRMLAQQGVPLLVVHPACEALLAYELEMIRSDTGAPLGVCYPGGLHPALTRLAAIAAADDEIGRVQQLTFRRSLVDRQWQNVRRHLACDAEMICRIAGRVDQVSALGAVKEAATANLSVQMSGLAGIVARWSVEPADSKESAELTLIGTEGKATLWMAADPRDWRLSISRGEEAQDETFEDYQDAEATLDAFLSLCQGESSRPDWNDACLSLEIVDCVPISLRRGRTIPIHPQQPSEEQTFKGMMAAGGCATLMFALLGLFAVAMVEAFRPPFREQLWWRLWPVYLLVPISIFLLLQLFQLVFHGRPRGDAGSKQTRETEQAK